MKMSWGINLELRSLDQKQQTPERKTGVCQRSEQSLRSAFFVETTC